MGWVGGLGISLIIRLSQPSFAGVGAGAELDKKQRLLQYIREAFQKKYYLDREIVPIPSDTPTIETVSEYLDKECW